MSREQSFDKSAPLTPTSLKILVNTPGSESMAHHPHDDTIVKEGDWLVHQSVGRLVGWFVGRSLFQLSIVCLIVVCQLLCPQKSAIGYWFYQRKIFLVRKSSSVPKKLMV